MPSFRKIDNHISDHIGWGRLSGPTDRLDALSVWWSASRAHIHSVQHKFEGKGDEGWWVWWWLDTFGCHLRILLDVGWDLLIRKGVFGFWLLNACGQNIPWIWKDQYIISVSSDPKVGNCRQKKQDGQDGQWTSMNHEMTMLFCCLTNEHRHYELGQVHRRSRSRWCKSSRLGPTLFSLVLVCSSILSSSTIPVVLANLCCTPICIGFICF